MMGNFGRGIVEYVSQYEMSGYVYVDSSVYVSKPTLSGIYFGGAFLNNFSTALNHIAVADDVLTSIEKREEQKTETVIVFPNPSNEAITIQYEGEWANYSLFSIDGREILRGRLQPQGMIPAQKAGIYLLNIESERGIAAIKVVFKP
jgi:muconolactone delta-isomerase